MYEVWKKWEVHQNARKVHRAEVLVRKVGQMGKATFGRPRFGEKSSQAGRNIDLVQEGNAQAVRGKE